MSDDELMALARKSFTKLGLKPNPNVYLFAGEGCLLGAIYYARDRQTGHLISGNKAAIDLERSYDWVCGVGEGFGGDPPRNSEWSTADYQEGYKFGQKGRKEFIANASQ